MASRSSNVNGSPDSEDLHETHHKVHHPKDETHPKVHQDLDAAAKKGKQYTDDGGAKDDGEEFPWVVVAGGAAAVAAAIAGLVFLTKRNPDADVRVRRTASDASHHAKGAYGSGERRSKSFFQKFKQFIGLGGGYHDDDDDDDDEGYGHGHSHSSSSGYDDGDFYKVKSGDNMEKIARKTGKRSWHEIAEENPSFRNPNLIHPGDRLRV